MSADKNVLKAQLSNMQHGIRYFKMHFDIFRNKKSNISFEFQCHLKHFLKILLSRKSHGDHLLCQSVRKHQLSNVIAYAILLYAYIAAALHR